MKKVTVMLMAAMLLSSIAMSADIIPNPPPVPTNGFPSDTRSILQTAIGYFGAHNPELADAFQNRKGEVWTGADYQDKINISSSVGLEYNVLNFSSNTNASHYLALESVTRNAGIAGTIVSEQLDAKFKVVVQGDLELGFFAGGGYSLNPDKRPFITVGADIKKALTQNTWGGFRLENQFQRGAKSRPVVSVLVGVNF